MIADIFNIIFYDPIFSLLVFIHDNITAHLWLAVILLTIVIRLILFPLFYKSAKDQTLMQKIQPLITEIKEKHKDDKEKQAKALMDVYKKHRLNPFSGIIMLVIQVPIFIALFMIFRNAELLTSTFDNYVFLGLINLGEASVVLAVVAGIFQYFQARVSMSIKKSTPARRKNKKNLLPLANMGKTMMYFTPFISFIVLINLPSALALYWITTALFSLGQQVIINKQIYGENETKNRNND